MSSRWAQYGVKVLAWLALLGAVTGTERTLRGMGVAWVPPRAEAVGQWNPELFRALTFGQVPVAVDWLMIRAFADPGYARVRASTRPRVFYDLYLAAQLDPAFFETYFYGASLLSVFWSDGEGARDLLLRANEYRARLDEYPPEFRARFWPDEWRIPMLLGYVYLFDLDRMPEAAEQFRAAGALPGAPAHLGRLAESLSVPGGEYGVGLKLLGFMMATARSPATRAEFAKKRDSLFMAELLHRLNRDFRAFLERQPAYRKTALVSFPELARFWDRFRRENNLSDRDPWGGVLRVEASGRIRTTTPFEPVFGLK